MSQNLLGSFPSNSVVSASVLLGARRALFLFDQQNVLLLFYFLYLFFCFLLLCFIILLSEVQNLM